MPVLDSAQKRAFALDVVQRLRDAGFTAYWAGGCVRDQLLGQAPKDYDVATDARPEAVRELFGRRRTLAIGAAFGVIAVRGRRSEGMVEVATFRSDASYSDGRHPDAVVFSSPREDAARRDFTINGIYYDPLAEETIDFVGGEADLRAGVIRAIGDPEHRLAEDKLRMLRAVRFAAEFEFQIEPATFAAISEMAAQIQVVSAERIGVELRSMLTRRHRRQACQLLQDTGLLAEVLPELALLAEQSPGDGAWNETLRALAALREPSISLALAAALHLATEGIAATVGRRLRYSNRETERTAWLLEHWRSIIVADRLPWHTLQPMLVHPGSEELLRLAEALLGQNAAAVTHCREKLALPADQLNPDPLVTGNDLIAAGLKPGRRFRDVLARIREAQLESQIATSDEAIALARQILAE